jgi:hypothetical protein
LPACLLRALQRILITRHCSLCLLAGVLLGSVWWDIDEGNYQARIGLFATAYMFINLFSVDAIEGTIVGRSRLLSCPFKSSSRSHLSGT